jgi:hypothetical protein
MCGVVAVSMQDGDRTDPGCMFMGGGRGCEGGWSELVVNRESLVGMGLFLGLGGWLGWIGITRGAG